MFHIDMNTTSSSVPTARPLNADEAQRLEEDLARHRWRETGRARGPAWMILIWHRKIRIIHVPA